MSENFSKTQRTTIRRLPKRGFYDRETIYRILDEGLICHVGFSVGNMPFVIPTIYGRDGETLYFHGAKASRMLKTLSEGVEACVTVTLVDGLVLARSAFHHSMNYRSVVIFGKASQVVDKDEKLKALLAISEHLIPGRWAEAREPNERELNATSVLSLPITEASAKVRTGGPVDDEEDYDLPIWAGELPLKLIAGEPITDSRQKIQVEIPDYIRAYSRNKDGKITSDVSG